MWWAILGVLLAWYPFAFWVMVKAEREHGTFKHGADFGEIVCIGAIWVISPAMIPVMIFAIPLLVIGCAVLRLARGAK